LGFDITSTRRVIVMRKALELPRFSLNERERRWTEIRKVMREKNLDCLLLCGVPLNWDFKVSNARFVSQIGGNAEYNFVVFPFEDEPTCFISMPTFVPYWERSQDWVKDIRPKKGPWADNVVPRLKELGLEKKNIGVDGIAGPLDPDGWVPHSVYSRILELMPEANFMNTDDMLEKIRAVKSPEELEFLEKAARLGDLMLEACLQTAKPGVRECEVYGKMMEAMLANGGEEPTLFLWASDAYPFPHPFRLPTMRPLGKGDLIICEMHPKYGGYFTHVERTFCLGEPAKEYLNIYEGCLKAYACGMELFTPGKSITDAMNVIRETIESLGLGICETGIHGHGLSSQEYPRYRLHAAARADDNAVKAIGNELKPGMVFAFNIDLFDPRWRNGETGCVFAETVVVTDGKPRCLHSFPTNLQIIAS
jgi:Xaa-Pro dipeptidase